MKTIILFSLGLFSTLSVFAQIKVDALGDVEIGQVIKTTKHASNNLTTIQLKSPRWDGGFIIDYSGFYGASTFRPNEPWYGALGTSSHKWGTAYIAHIFTDMNVEVSDENVKENIRKIESPSEKLRQLNGIGYDIKDSYYKYANIKVDSSYFGPNLEQSKIKEADEAYIDNFRKKSKNQMGFIAQEFKEIFPELVYQMDDTSNFAIHYTGLIPVLVEAFKEQQVIIDEQSEKISKLEQSLESINNSKKSAAINSVLNESNTATDAVLYQNSPNPFTQNTTISYYIPDESSSAFIYIFDMNGGLVSSKEILQTGNASISINGNELDPGMYFYTLIIDNTEIDTKKMILTGN